jgi:hypothetical protein
MTTYDDYGFPEGAQHQYPPPPSLAARVWRQLHAFTLQYMIPWLLERIQHLKNGRWTVRSFLTLGKALALLWFIVLYWGERSVFKSSVADCQWENWENWVRCFSICYYLLHFPLWQPEDIDSMQSPRTYHRIVSSS